MNKSAPLMEFERRVEEQFGLTRGLLLGVGLACMTLGGLSVMLPLRFYGSLIQLVGLLAIGSGLTRAFQFLIGRQSAETRERCWPVVLAQVALDFAMGFLLIQDWRGSVVVVTIVFALMFLAEGGILFYMALRSPSKTSLTLLVLGGLLMGACGLVILFRLVPDPLQWAGIFVGLKLLTFGGTLAWIALRGMRTDPALLYEPAPLSPEVGKAYAVYFGTAFHLGVYIGDGEVVHYLNDNSVYRVTWDEFLSGRTPANWTFPDLDPVPPEVVVETALGEVGKTYPYQLFKFNCENFAIYCLSGGTTHKSGYAQISSGAESLARHPFLGMMAEFNTRLVEWLAFHFGGPSGKRLSLAIRRIGSVMTGWLVAAAQQANGRPTE
ncbi:lecithin retinol acyltransferase family protein [Tundrisphaera lichenicola]|uniref:lecithin retinol acyltransferase family protein n=1 Tax=Tundrisphaera lichenicola TaxID=2029860 RepID=UPI003EC078A4